MEKEKIIEEELVFQYSRSPGHGGQNVNKKNTKVQVFFDFKESKYLSEQEKNRLLIRYPEGLISVDAHEERSQLQNKQNTITKLIEILQKNLIIPKKRIASKIPENEKEKRYLDKIRQAEKKKERSKKIKLDND